MVDGVLLGYLLHFLWVVFLDYRLVGNGILLTLGASLLDDIVEDGIHFILYSLDTFNHITQLNYKFLKEGDGILVALHLGGCHIILALSCLEGGKHLGRLVSQGFAHPSNIVPLVIGCCYIRTIFLHSLFLTGYLLLESCDTVIAVGTQQLGILLYLKHTLAVFAARSPLLEEDSLDVAADMTCV